MEIRALGEKDADAWWLLRLEALEHEPLAFGKAAEEHRATPVEVIAGRFREEPAENCTLGAFEGARLVGTATLKREAEVKARHKASIFGVYVTPARRGKGIGKALIAALLEMARRDATLEQIHLAVSTRQEAAKRLYRGFHFQTWGTEPHASKVGIEYVDEDHMLLQLQPPA